MKVFRKMVILSAIISLAVCLSLGFSNTALALRPSSGKQIQGLAKLTANAEALGLPINTLSDFETIQQKIAEPVIGPLGAFVGSINQVSSEGKLPVFGANLPAGTIDVDSNQLEGLANVLGQYGLKIKSMKITPVRGNLDPNELLKVDGFKPLFNISVSGAAGSRFFAGEGKGIKELADGNAVFLGDASIRNAVMTDPQLAIGILGDEGKRDNSISLEVGSIYFSGYAQGGQEVRKVFATKEEFNAEIQRLKEAGVTVRGLVGDFLEVTNGLQDPKALLEPTNSWNLAALFDDPSSNPFVNDNGRVAGVSFNAPTNAVVDPLDLPSVALPKIAQASGIDIANPEKLADYMNHIAVFTLGPREAALKKSYEVSEKHRHQAIFDDVKELQKTYPGLKLILTGDGDAMPRMAASSGLKLSFGGKEYTMVVFGRSGANEAHASRLVAKNISGGQFANTYVSPKHTGDDYRSKDAKSFTEAEIKEFQEMGIPEEVYNTKQTRDAVKGNGVVMMTSVTGANADIFGDNFANLLQRIKVTPTVDKKGEAAISTFVVAPDGSIFVVTTQFEIADLAQAQASIKGASPEAKKYLAAQEEKQQAKEQFLKDLAGIIEVTPTEVKVLDRELFLEKGVDILANAAALSKNPDVKVAAKRVLLEVAPLFGIKLASDHEFYMAKQQGKWKNITVPAVNGRSTVYLSLKPLYRVAKEDNVSVVKTEVARSEQRYSDQDSSEIVSISIAAAIKEGWTGLLFVQQDHNQVNKEKWMKGGADRQKEIDARNTLFREGLLAGQYNIDLDPSTLVDEAALEEIIKTEGEFVNQYLQKHADLLTMLGGDKKAEGSLRRRLVDEIEIGDVEDKDFLALPDVAAKVKLLREELYPKMHKTSIEVTLSDIRTIRKLEKELGLTKSVSIGIEERHIDNPRHKDFPSTVLGSITLSQSILKAAQAEGLVAHSKISLQTGAMHGVGGVVDFGIYERHVKHADKIGVSVFVQHGASTLEKQDFDKMRAGDVGEVHLATEYQKIVFGIIAQEYPELAEKMAKWLENLMVKDASFAKKFKALWDAAFAQPGKDRKTVIGEILGDSSNMPKELKGKFKDLVKELSAPFKYELWNLPENVRQKIDKALYDEFKLIFGKLGVVDTKELIESIMPYEAYPVHLAPRPAGVNAVFGQKPQAQKALAPAVAVRSKAVIVDSGLLPVGGVTEILKAFAQLNDAYVVFYGPAAKAMGILSGEGTNIITFENEVQAVAKLKEMGITPDKIQLVATELKKEFEGTGIKQKIVSSDTASVLLGLTKAITEINDSSKTKNIFTDLYDGLVKAGVIVKNEVSRKSVLDVAVKDAEIVNVESNVKIAEQDAKIIKEVATRVGV